MKVWCETESRSAWKIAQLIAVVSGLTMLLQCTPADTRGIPEKIRVQAKTQEGYHLHISVLFYATSSRPFCHGVFGESPNYQKDFYHDIQSTGTEIEIKKRWDGYCDYRFELMVIACNREKLLPSSSDNSFETLTVGLLDSLESNPRKLEQIAHSPNRLVNNALNIRVNGSKAHFWGCDSNCENNDDFGIDNTNTQLSIDCREE